MLTQEGCHARQQRLWNAVPNEIEWLLIADPRHVLYLSNFLVHPLSFSGGERGLLLLERGGDVSLLADNFAFRSSTATPYVDNEIIEGWYNHKNSIINRDHALLAAVKSISEKLYGRKGVVEAEWIPLGAWDVLGLDHESHSISREVGEERQAEHSIDLGTLLRELRRQKEPDEIALMKKCMAACDAGHARAMEFIKPGVSELDIYREVQSAAIAAAGCPALVYGDFRANNALAPKAGGLPTGYVLQEGDLFILDYSVVINGYRSDFTNTIAAGQPTKDQETLFKICQAAMQAGEQLLQAGVSAKDVYNAVSKPMEAAGYPALGHHAGHGLGLGHPESPILVPESTDTLLTGDVITLEPGMYIEGIGGMRIEHNYLITETGYERLSNHNITLS